MECDKIEYVNEIVENNQLIIYANIWNNGVTQINYSEDLTQGYETAKQKIIDRFNENYPVKINEVIEE
jgi:hypothetical protein